VGVRGERRVSFTYHQRQQAYAAARRIVDKFARDDLELARRARDARPDGYRTSSMAAGGGQGPSDPTGRAALARATGPADVAELAFARLFDAVALLAEADGLRARAFPPQQVRADDGLSCTNCAAAGVHSPRGSAKEVGRTSTLCGWCHAFQRSYGLLPPRVLVRKRAAGERIYDRDITQALHNDARPPERPTTPGT
jgi:hypothetical protein